MKHSNALELVNKMIDSASQKKHDLHNPWHWYLLMSQGYCHVCDSADPSVFGVGGNWCRLCDKAAYDCISNLYVHKVSIDSCRSAWYLWRLAGRVPK